VEEKTETLTVKAGVQYAGESWHALRLADPKYFMDDGLGGVIDLWKKARETDTPEQWEDRFDNYVIFQLDGQRISKLLRIKPSGVYTCPEQEADRGSVEAVTWIGKSQDLLAQLKG
jgi:hypothetical protein